MASRGSQYIESQLEKYLVRRQATAYYAAVKMAQQLAVTVIMAALVLSISVPANARIQPSAKPTQDPAAPTAAEQEMFSKGQKLYLQGNYTQAAEVLVEFLKSYPNSIITDLSLLWLGRSYYQLGKFTEATQVGKRLRAIKDTPFADIYDGELESARREAVSRERNAASGDNAASPGQRRETSSRPVSLTSRNRFAGAIGTTRSSPLRNVTSNTTKSPPAKPTTASHSNAGVKSNRQLTRQRVNAAPVDPKRPTVASHTTARARVLSAPSRNRSASDGEVRRSTKANQPSRQPAISATQHRTTPNRQITGAKPKPLSPSRALGTGSSAHISLPGGTASVQKPAPRQSNLGANQSVARNISPRRTRSTASDRPTASEPESPRQAPGRKRSIAGSFDNSVRSTATATGGLYSMIDASATNAPVGTMSQAMVSVISKRVNAKPGELVYLSFIVRNSGTARQTYEFRLSAPGAPEAKIYVDSNGDGIHQSDELPVTGSPVVELANSELSLLLEITVPRNAFEGQQYSYTLTVLSFDKEEVIATATSTLTVSSIRARRLPQNVSGDNAVLAALAKSP